MKVIALLIGCCMTLAGCEEQAVEATFPSNTIKANVNGKEWTASAKGLRMQRLGREVVSVSGFRMSDNSSITISLDGISSAGSFKIEGESEFMSPRFVQYMTRSDAYYAEKGLITVSEISQQKAKGTFSFMAINPDAPYSPDTLTITNGEFDVAF
jgi:hypothetical protein